jgi:hypothetical protein
MELRLKPNMVKVAVWLLLKVMVAALGIVAAVVGFNYVSNGAALSLAEELGITINMTQLVLYGLAVFAVAAIVLLAISMVAVGSQSMHVSDTGIVVDGRPLSFDNVARVTYKTSGLSDSVMRKGRLVFELTGVNRDSIDIDFIDRPEEVINQVQRAISTYRMKRYARFAQEERVEKIMDKF